MSQDSNLGAILSIGVGLVGLVVFCYYITLLALTLGTGIYYNKEENTLVFFWWIPVITYTTLFCIFIYQLIWG